jgi:hypothetical protein
MDRDAETDRLRALLEPRQFEVIKPLASGGMGVLWLLWNQQLQRKEVAKEPRAKFRRDRTFRERFVDEALDAPQGITVSVRPMRPWFGVAWQRLSTVGPGSGLPPPFQQWFSGLGRFEVKLSDGYCREVTVPGEAPWFERQEEPSGRAWIQPAPATFSELYRDTRLTSGTDLEPRLVDAYVTATPCVAHAREQLARIEEGDPASRDAPLPRHLLADARACLEAVTTSRYAPTEPAKQADQLLHQCRVQGLLAVFRSGQGTPRQLDKVSSKLEDALDALTTPGPQGGWLPDPEAATPAARLQQFLDNASDLAATEQKIEVEKNNMPATVRSCYSLRYRMPPQPPADHPQDLVWSLVRRDGRWLVESWKVAP